MMTRLVTLALVAALSVGVDASAQQAPDAGRLLQEATPGAGRAPSAAPPPELRLPQPAPARPASAAAGPSFRLTGVRFAGNTVMSADELAPLAADSIGRDVTLGDLEAIAERVTRRYRDAGYFLAQAIVPRQEPVGGVIEISVIEGRLAKVRIEREEAVPIDEARLRAFVARLVPGAPLTEKALERTMLLLSDLNGIAVRSSLQEGEEPGTVDLIVEVAATRRLAGQVEFDNFGLKSSGEYRLGGGVRLASPFGLGDNLDARAQVTSANRTDFGRLSYERPIGVDGMRAGIGFSSLGYALGGEFAALEAEGYARVLDFSLFAPIRRSRSETLVVSAALQRKWVEDRYAAVEFTSTRNLFNLVGGLALERRDRWFGGGYVNASVMLTAGHVDIASQAARELDQGANGRRTEGSFTKLNYSLSRLQALMPKWTLFGAVVGQMASSNLDNAERFGIGGPRAVRAYSSGALVADQGAVASAELRYSVHPQVTLSLFYDAGRARINHDAIESVTANSRSLRGWGLGFFWGRPASFQVQGSLAWRISQPVPGDANDRRPRLYMQGVKYF